MTNDEIEKLRRPQPRAAHRVLMSEFITFGQQFIITTLRLHNHKAALIMIHESKANVKMISDSRSLMLRRRMGLAVSLHAPFLYLRDSERDSYAEEHIRI